MALSYRIFSVLWMGLATQVSLSPAPDGERAVEAGGALRLKIAVTGDTRGALEDCGCEERQAGGLDRRKTAFDALEGDVGLILDLGGMFAAGGDQDLFLGRSTLLLYADLGYDAVNFGWGESRAGPVEVIKSDTDRGLMISSNLVTTNGEYPLPRYRIVTYKGVRVLIAGVLSQGALTEFPGGRDTAYRIEDPLKSLESVLRQTEGEYDAAVALCHMFEPEAATLADSIEGYDLLIGGWRVAGKARMARETNTPLFLFNGDRGRWFALIDIPLDPAGEPSGFAQELDDGFDREHGMTSSIEAVREAMTLPPDRLEGVPLPPPFESAKPPMNRDYVGSSSCLPCHGAQSAGHALTVHSSSMVTLVLKGESQNEDCLRCHVTAYGVKNGFRSRLETPLFAEVGCEACHGPGARHMAFVAGFEDRIRKSDVNDALSSERSRILRTPGPGSCADCHDDKNDPDFDYNRDLRKVAHSR